MVDSRSVQPTHDCTVRRSAPAFRARNELDTIIAMSDEDSSRTEQLLVLLAEELYLIRFLLTNREREDLKAEGGIVGKMEADIDCLRDKLGF